MRAVGVKGGRGSADALFIDETVTDPVVKQGHILVDIKAFGLNRMDIMQREDKYPYPLLPESGPIMGVEFSGIVQRMGPNCECPSFYSKYHIDDSIGTSDFKSGDKVFGLAYGGAVSKFPVEEQTLANFGR